MSYRPSEPYCIPVELFNPTYETVKGVTKKVYPEKGEVIFCSFKTYGGTETTVNDQLVVVDTATIETWYRPDITSSSVIKLNNKTYEVIGEPENIEMRNQFMKFKVQAVKGGA
jgi:SPP1 family predicted phage head-tail adaptor